MLKTLFILLFSTICCSFAFRALAIQITKKFDRPIKTDIRAFEDHRSTCYQCTEVLDNINVYPCTKGFSIIFKEARKHE